jgi:hypothetical protein
LSSLAVEAIEGLDPFGRLRVLSVDLNILRIPAADAFDVGVLIEPGAGRTMVAVVTFTQGRPVAVASIHLTPALAAVSIAIQDPPTVLPPEVYPEMVVKSSATSPPVMFKFAYRPVVGPGGGTSRAGWDQVWVRPLTPSSGSERVLQTVDCWYPANHGRFVRDYLEGRRNPELGVPTQTTLLAAHTVLPHPVEGTDTTSDVLVETHVDAIVSGVHFEQWQMWSEGGQLLAKTLIVRRDQTA